MDELYKKLKIKLLNKKMNEFSFNEIQPIINDKKIFEHLILTSEISKKYILKINHDNPEILNLKFDTLLFEDIAYIVAFLHDFGKNKNEYGTNSQYYSIILSSKNLLEKLDMSNVEIELILFIIKNGTIFNDINIYWRGQNPPTEFINKSAKKLLDSLSGYQVKYAENIIHCIWILSTSDAISNKNRINENLYYSNLKKFLGEINVIKNQRLGLLKLLKDRLEQLTSPVNHNIEFAIYNESNPSTLKHAKDRIEDLLTMKSKYGQVLPVARNIYFNSSIIREKCYSKLSNEDSILLNSNFDRTWFRVADVRRIVLGSPLVIAFDPKNRFNAHKAKKLLGGFYNTNFSEIERDFDVKIFENCLANSEKELHTILKNGGVKNGWYVHSTANNLYYFSARHLDKVA